MSTLIQSVSGECCNPTGKYELCGCANGVPHVQLTVVGGGTVQTIWLNTETGDTFTTKPAGFLTGTCQEAELSDVLKFSATAPTATAPFANPKDGYTTIQTSDGTENGDVVALHLYDEQTGTWKEIKLTPEFLIADVTEAPGETGNTPGPRMERDADGNVWFIDTEGNSVQIEKAPVEPETCKGAHYEQVTLVPGAAVTVTHGFAMTNVLAIGYSVRGVNGTTVGDWPTGVRFINHTANSVDVIADGIGGVVDVALFNTECLGEIIVNGAATGGGGGSTAGLQAQIDALQAEVNALKLDAFE